MWALQVAWLTYASSNLHHGYLDIRIHEVPDTYLLFSVNLICSFYSMSHNFTAASRTLVVDVLCSIHLARLGGGGKNIDCAIATLQPNHGTEDLILT